MRVVAALGGNALLRRGEPLTAENQRANVAEKVGEIKRAEGSPFFRPDRVAQVIDKIQNANQGIIEINPAVAIPNDRPERQIDKKVRVVTTITYFLSD